MKPGAYDGIENAQYHGGPGASKSTLDLVHRSPAHLKAVRDAANDNAPRAPTPAQAFGTAFHALALEPDSFARDYCLALRPSDVPDVIEGKDQLVAMVQELNSKRRQKLATSGSKADLIARIRVEAPDSDAAGQALDDFSAGELKTAIDIINRDPARGLLSERGTMEELATLLRANGCPVTLWADVKAEWMRNNGARTVLSPDDWDHVHRMRDALLAHPAAGALLTSVPGVAERSVYWNDPETGELCRCRPDFWRKDGILVDLKSTEDAGPEEFARSILNWRYFVQHPFYLDGINHARQQTADDEWQRDPVWPASRFVFVAVEKKPPYAVGVYVLDEASIEQGRAEYRRDLAVYAECQRSGAWPAYSERIEPIGLPPWYFMRQAQAAA